MDNKQMLRDHADQVRTLSYNDEIALDTAIRRAKMLVRNIVPSDDHYIKEIDAIGFYSNVYIPASLLTSFNAGRKEANRLHHCWRQLQISLRPLG
jgi:hypothetical protein